MQSSENSVNSASPTPWLGLKKKINFTLISTNKVETMKVLGC
jgi:hypothetical protein